MIDGSTIHDKPEQKAQPFLYGYSKSNLWERQCLELTVIYTNIAQHGLNVGFDYGYTNDENELMLDGSVPGGVAKHPAGGVLKPLERQIIDPAVMNGLNIANELTDESTIYSQALGQAVQGNANAAYSTVALLNQAGRLPLTTIQKSV